MGEIEEKRIRSFYLLNISGGGISKIMSLQKADLYIDIICITQNKIVKNKNRRQYITKDSLNKKIYID